MIDQNGQFIDVAIINTILLKSSVLGKQIALVHVGLVLVPSSVATTSLVG